MQGIKPNGASVITLGASANTVLGAVVVQVVNSNTTTSAVITVANATANGTSGVCVVPPMGMIAIEKLTGDTLTSNLTAGVFASSIAYTY